MLKLAMLPFLAFAFLLQPRKASKPVDFKKSIAPFVKKYCVGCHSGPNAKAGIDLSKFKIQADVDRNTRVWKRAGREVGGGNMPPQNAPAQPKDAERKLFTDWCAQLPKSKQ